MDSNVFDNVTDRLQELLLQREQFQARHGARAAEFLEGLPGLFHLFHRLTFDLDVPAEERRKAAAIAVYIAEAQDYLGEANLGVEGLIDDLWLAYSGLHQIAQKVPVELLQGHWRADRPFFHVLDLSRRVRELEPHLPARVLGLLEAFSA
jgi:hypothetical protein